MPTIDEIISGIIIREGGAKVTNTPGDAGGRTQYGISEKSNPAAWLDGKVTEAEARAIYLKKYVEFPGFNKITDLDLVAQLVDFGVNSGPMIAIKYLQQLVGVDVDFQIGPKTLEAIYLNLPGLHNRLVAERVKMIGKIVVKNPSQIKFLSGWLNRALEFLK